MRKAPLLLGLAATLAAGLALILYLGRPHEGERGGERVAAAVRPSDEPGSPAGTELTSTGHLDPEDAAGGDRVEARVEKRVTPGAERVFSAASEGDSDELYGIVLGIYGVPVGGAEVKVESIGDTADGLLQVLGGSTDKTAITKSDGTFRVPRPGRWEEVHVTITARGFLDFDRSQDLVDRDGDQDLGVFELEAGVVLAGKVYDADGKPVAGANVTRSDSMEPSFRFRGGFGGNDGVKTADDGSFEMLHEEPGDYVLVVDHEDHPTGRFPGVTPPAGMEDSGIVLRLPRGATIAGKINEYPVGRDHVRVAAQLVDPKTDGGEAGMAAVFEESGFSADGLESEVDAAGSFSIKGLEAGKSYRVRAFVRGGFFGRTAVSEERTTRAGDQQVELTWDPGGRITGRVVDEATGGAVKDVDVRFRWDTESGNDFDFSNQTRRRGFRTGEIEIDELRPRAGQKTLSLLLSAPGYLDTRHEGVAVTAESDVDIGTIRMKRAPIVRLRVVDAEGDGVSRARVRLAPEEPEGDSTSGGMRGGGPSGWFSLDKQAATGKTDSDGVLELPAPATATARLEIGHPKYAGYVREGVTMPTQGTREETAQLSVGGTIEVLVVDEQGNPVPDLSIRHRYPKEALEDDTASHEVNKRGELRLRNELPGIHAFRTNEQVASADGEEPEWTEVVVVDGRTANVVLEVAPRATLEGKITEAGAPLDRATVTLLDPMEEENDAMVIELSGRGSRMYRRGGGSGSSDRTDRVGRYSLEDVPAGRYRLSVSHAERAAPHIVPVTIRGGGNRLDVDLPLNAVEGRIVDSGGAPIEGASLRLVPAAAEENEKADVERHAFEELFGGNRDSAKSGPDGSYRLRGVPTDRPFHVQASRDGYVAAKSEPVTVSVGQLKGNVDISLQSGGTLRVHVVGETSPFFFLRARWEGGGKDAPSQKMTMVRRGEAVFKGLKPGPWRISKSDADAGEGQVVDVKIGGETEIDFAL